MSKSQQRGSVTISRPSSAAPRPSSEHIKGISTQQEIISLAIELFRKEQFLDDKGCLKPGIIRRNMRDGSWYEGESLDHRTKFGSGIYKFANGDCYLGQWSEDKFHGYGAYLFARGQKYLGRFSQGLKHGSGVFTQEHGSVYRGQFRHDKRNGKGLCKYSNGEIYDGEWKQDEKHGHGTFKYQFGDEYTGQWKEGKKHGHGEFVYSDKAILKSEFKDDKANGQGVMIYPNGDIFEGAWLQGFKKGHGVIQYSNNDRYEGNFDYDLPNGLGKYYFSNGDIYQGPFKNGVQHGFGKYYSACDGSTQQCIWQSGKRKVVNFSNETPIAKKSKGFRSPIVQTEKLAEFVQRKNSPKSEQRGNQLLAFRSEKDRPTNKLRAKSGQGRVAQLRQGYQRLMSLGCKKRVVAE